MDTDSLASAAREAEIDFEPMSLRCSAWSFGSQYSVWDAGPSQLASTTLSPQLADRVLLTFCSLYHFSMVTENTLR